MGYENLKFSTEDVFLVTGAAGFIGSNIVEALLKMNMKVRALDSFATGKEENLTDFYGNQNFEFINGDIRDYEVCTKASDGATYVLHQAALGSVPRSIEYPTLYESVNIGGTLNMMQAARCASVKRFVYASSSSVYGSSTKLPKVEGEEGDILSPYALTKKVDEEYAALYWSLYKLPTVGLRYFNVFGRRQDPFSQYAAVIPLFVKKLLAGEAPVINGDGEQSRDFTYIENVIEANLKACLAPEEVFGTAFNVAYGESFTLNQVYSVMKELVGVNIEPIYGPERSGDVRHSLADTSRARKQMGYSPSWDFRSGFKAAIDWYKEYLK